MIIEVNYFIIANVLLYYWGVRELFKKIKIKVHIEYMIKLYPSSWIIFIMEIRYAFHSECQKSVKFNVKAELVAQWRNKIKEIIIYLISLISGKDH